MQPSILLLIILGSLAVGCTAVGKGHDFRIDGPTWFHTPHGFGEIQVYKGFIAVWPFREDNLVDSKEDGLHYEPVGNDFSNTRCNRQGDSILLEDFHAKGLRAFRENWQFAKLVEITPNERMWINIVGDGVTVCNREVTVSLDERAAAIRYRKEIFAPASVDSLEIGEWVNA